MNIIKTYKSIVIVFAILISLSIVPSLLPHPRYILLILMLGSIFLTSLTTPLISVAQSVPFKILMLLWFIFLVADTLSFLFISAFAASALFSRLGFITIFFFYFIVLNDYKKYYGFQNLLRLYVILCILISVTGLITWSLLTFNFIEPNNWFVNIGDLTSGRFPIRGDKFHVAPYYLGLVQFQEAQKFTMFGTQQQLFRLSGISSESQYAALLVAPSSFLVYPVFNGNRKLKRFLLAIIVLFLICTFSFTLYIIMFFLLFLYSFRTKSMKIMILWIAIVVSLFSFYYGNRDISETDLLMHKYRSGIAEGTWPHKVEALIKGIYKTDTLIFQEANSKYNTFFVYASYYTLMISSALFAIRLIFSRRPHWYVGFSVLYILIHFMKGMGTVIIYWPFFLFIISLMGYAYQTRSKEDSTFLSGERKMHWLKY